MLLSLFLLMGCQQNKQTEKLFSEQRIIQSAIQGEKSKGQKIVYSNSPEKIINASFSLKGKNANSWRVEYTSQNEVKNKDSVAFFVFFEPIANFIGIAQDTLILTMEHMEIVYSLKGLSTKALEGNNEPPLADVVTTLGYAINLGWTDLANHVLPDLQGDELPPSLFQKIGPGKVYMTPVARYSPPFSLPFGYYTSLKDTIVKHQVGVLEGSEIYPEHQTLYPALAQGKNSFDPKDKLFGFYTTSPSHDAYSEDKWNAIWFKENVAHAARIYEVKNAEGSIISGQYLVCFEEASNGDYQDYVFLLENITAVAIKDSEE